MMKIKIIAMGKLKEKYLREAMAEYEKRLSSLCEFEVIELDPVRLLDNPTNGEKEAALKREADLITAKIPKNTQVVAMCIEGKQLTSEELGEFFATGASFGQSNITFIIGSSYGLDDSIKQTAAVKLSMSKMTFPHQLARVMLAEQIYRAFKINTGGTYHK